jgi:hypothetical protein
MAKRKKSRTRPLHRVDSSFEKPKKRGRPQKVRPSEVYGRALNYRGTFELIWDKLREALLKTSSETQVIEAFEAHAASYAHEFVPALAGLVFKVVHHPKFPKRRGPQIKYLADSLAAYGRVTAKRSREIVAQELAKENAKLKHRVLRREFYIVCSCGYEGPTFQRKCPRKHPGQNKMAVSDIFLNRFI